MAKAKLGSFNVAASSTHKCGWKLRHVTYENNVRTTKVIPQELLHSLGFGLEMSLVQARARARQLNLENREQAAKIKAAGLKALALSTSDELLFPPDLVAEFSQIALEDSGRSDDYRQKVAFHWEAIQRLVKDANIKPQDYAERALKIYSLLARERYSLSYSKKLITLLNQWGRFYCKRRALYFQEVPMPRGREQEKITDAYEAGEPRGESKPLSPQLLLDAKTRFAVSHFNWHSLAMWFALRPIEVDGMGEPNEKRWYIESDKDLRVDVLWVYQPKLTSIAREKRWKGIPVFLPEQKALATALKTTGLPIERPTAEANRAALGEGYSNYAGRKGFMDLMLNKGQQLEDISAWMGHQKVDRTWASYRNRRRVSFKKVG